MSRFLGSLPSPVAEHAWCLLFVPCWPLALLALVSWPFAWWPALPFGLIGITFLAMFAFQHALLLLPARVLAWRERTVQVT